VPAQHPHREMRFTALVPKRVLHRTAMGINDTFHPVGKGVVIFNILIYDRWGKKVYESNAMEPGLGRQD